jgi:hypothetical protein
MTQFLTKCLLAYMTAASANPLLPNLTHPVFPESLTATIKALSPFLNAPIGFTYGLASSLEARKGNSRSYHVNSFSCVLLGRGRLRWAYWGPTLFIGPVGSSGRVSKIEDSWWIVGIGTVLPLWVSQILMGLDRRSEGKRRCKTGTEASRR